MWIFPEVFFSSSSMKTFSLDVIESSVNISQLLFELLQKVYNRDKVNRNYPLTREQLYDLIQFCFCSLYWLDTFKKLETQFTLDLNGRFYFLDIFLWRQLWKSCSCVYVFSLLRELTLQGKIYRKLQDFRLG
jgi:hypothetical protein